MWNNDVVNEFDFYNLSQPPTKWRGRIPKTSLAIARSRVNFDPNDHPKFPNSHPDENMTTVFKCTNVNRSTLAIGYQSLS